MSASERVKITEDVRKYAAEYGVSEGEALQSGMQQKAKEFAADGGATYVKA